MVRALTPNTDISKNSIIVMLQCYQMCVNYGNRKSHLLVLANYGTAQRLNDTCG